MRLFLVAGLLLCSCIGTSQIILKKPSAPELPGMESLYKYLATPKATFLFDTDKAKVYALPLDNMPCLVPKGYHSNMPVAKLIPTTQMPNASNLYELIPKNEDRLLFDPSIEKLTPRK